MSWTTIDRACGTPLFRQIYETFRRRILQGELQSGEKLPSTRELASSLQVSRTVIVEAYEQLLAEGYIEGRHGSGTYVAEGAYLQTVGAAPEGPVPGLALSSPLPGRPDLIDFRHGLPALDLFPRKLWGELAKRTCSRTAPEAFGYGRPEGRSELRQTLCHYLRRSRGVLCEPDQLIVTTGATQAISLIARMLLTGQSDVLLEDPLTHEIHTMFALPGTALHAVPVDGQGMMTHLLPTGLRPKLIYVTPSHQFPLGGVLPIQRRVQLMEYAARTGSYIVEDDYDSEFRYDSAPVSSLQGLDPDRVVYIGTFSKILSPALRLGYLILPSSLVENARQHKWLTDLHTPSLEQLVLAEFIEEGHLERHVSRMKKIYRKRRDFLIHCLTRSFGDKVTVAGYSTGIHLIAEFAGISFTPELLSHIENKGVRVYPAAFHAYRKEEHRHRLILGYGNLAEEQVEEGIRRLHAVLNNYWPHKQENDKFC
ncbi:PLP-dependent aminotransferase family protein [Cohnella boryungensis]|uniref:PLP-dependent aminotransferase family protein n=1 Tax=Cohnella boryungensis TaxID=768479 RepID=A0ABV8SAZ9_9BACL